MKKFIEPSTAAVERALNAILEKDEETLIQASSDLDLDGTYGRRWVVVTGKRVLILPDDGAAECIEVSLDEVISARTESLVGGARLEIERREKPTVQLPYTHTEAAKFSNVAVGIEQLRKGESPEIDARIDRVRCQKCDRPLPEKNGICPACIRRLATLGRIAGYLRPYKKQAVLLAFASVLTTVAELIPPLITKRIVDDVLVPAEGEGAVSGPEARVTLLGLLVLALVGVRVVTWAAEWIRGWTVAWLGARVTTDIRSQLYKQLELLSLSFYDKRQVGAVTSRVTRDSNRLQDFLVDGLPYLVINGLMLLGILGLLLYMSWKLAIYVLLPVPIITVWATVYWRRMRVIFRKWMQAWSVMISRTNEVLRGIGVVKAFGGEEGEIGTFERLNLKLTRTAVRTEVNRVFFFATMTFLTGLGVIIVWFFGGEDVIRGEVTLGTLLAFYSYMWLLYGPLHWFGRVNSWMSRAFAGAERIFEIADIPGEAYEDPDAVAMPNIQGHVRFRDVSFGYDKSKPVLHNIDLNVAAGEMIGLVGKSGVGKTTTVNLLCRFYEIDRGSIEIDGVDLRKIRLTDLRDQIGIVLQEPLLFSGSIAENIAYGRPGARFDEIVAAARAANAHDFIVAKPDGYDAQVGERGGSLSGGERQRVSLARAMLHDPKILILDEATSSVDVEAEKKIQGAIGRLIKGRTTFAIAHRLSTLRDADRLVVLEDGRIVEIGTQQALLDRQGKFYGLVKLQQEIAEMIAVGE